jgi:hypothetical protein
MSISLGLAHYAEKKGFTNHLSFQPLPNGHLADANHDNNCCARLTRIVT